MRITLHRHNQIGGCITEIVSSKGTRIFVDLGHNLPKGDQESEDEYASEDAVTGLIGDARAIFYTHMHGANPSPIAGERSSLKKLSLSFNPISESISLTNNCLPFIAETSCLTLALSVCNLSGTCRVIVSILKFI